MAYIPDVIARKNGKQEITYDIPCMEKYLKDTYGITVYQEQVMLLSRLLADFTRGESDALRKAMGKKKKDIVDAMKPKFIEGGKKNGHDPKVLEKIWGDWEKFASYAFNKSHAACYSWVAYQTAYIKAHYPSEFMAALLTRRYTDIKETTKLLEECKALGIKVLGPDVNESHADFGVNGKGQIRFGLKAIKGFGDASAEAVVKEREKNGPFADIFDFVQRLPMSVIKRSGLECLALSGAYDAFSQQIRREQFFAKNTKGEAFVDLLNRFGTQYLQAQQEAQFSLFGMEAIEVNRPAIPPAEPWGTLERLNKERELVGHFLSAHPLDEFRIILENVCNLHMEHINDLTPLANQEFRCGGIVTSVSRKVSSKTNKPFGIVTIEDFTGAGEILLFDEDCRTWMGYMEEGNTLYVSGRVEPRFRDSTQMALRVKSIRHLTDAKKDIVKSITIQLHVADIDDIVVSNLAQLVQDSPGPVSLQFRFIDTDGRTELSMKSAYTIELTHHLAAYMQSTEGITYKINE